MAKKRFTIKDTTLAIRQTIPSVFTTSEFKGLIENLQEQYQFSEDSKTKLYKMKQFIETKNSDPARPMDFYKIAGSEVNELDIAKAISRTRKYYLSHHTAMYIHELFNQKPSNFYLTKEVLTKKRPEKFEQPSEMAIERAFSKQPRHTSRFVSFSSHKYFLTEKISYENIGIMKFEDSPIDAGAIVQYFVSDLERTFIDSIMAPQYSGGLLNILESFSNVDLSIETLDDYYHKIRPVYPYWQAIGFVLEQINPSLANAWEAIIGRIEKVPFYIQHGADDTWKLSTRWYVYHPKGIL